MKTWEKRLIIFILLILILITGGIFLFPSSKSTLNVNTKTQISTPAPINKIQVSISINTGNVPVTTQNIAVEEGKTALDLTYQVASVSALGEGVNAYITGINDRVVDSNLKEFWELIVNGKSSEVGAGSYLVKDGDIIEWKISKF